MKVIACFGDSLIQGFPFGNRYAWIAEAEARSKIKMLNYGLCGDCCDDIFSRMKNTMLPDYVEYILFLGGANDIIQMRPQKFILQDMEKAAVWCNEKNYKLCICLPLISAEAELNIYLNDLKNAIKEKLADKAYLLDLQPAIGDNMGELKKAYLDGVHPTNATYKAMGAYAAPLLKKWAEEE